jgi:hypothetical protein
VAPTRQASAVEPSRTVAVLAVCVGLLSAVAATTGLLWTGGTAPESVVSVRGEQVDLYGVGLYRYDSVFRGAGNRGTDLATLVVGLPLLWFATRWYRRGSSAGALLLSGALTWFLYVYASVSLGAAYNEMFLVHVALVSVSLWALVLTARAVRVDALPRDGLARVPVRSLTALLVAAGTVTALVWVQPILTTWPTGAPPTLQGSTTLVTEVLDLALVAPTAVVAGVLLHRRRWSALVLAVPLLVLLVVLAFAITAQTAAQLVAGWQFTVPELVGPLGGFLVLGGAAAWLLMRTLGALGPPHRGTAGPVSSS